MARNDKFHSVMESSYTETVQRCRLLQERLDSAEVKHREETKQAELDYYRLKER